MSPGESAPTGVLLMTMGDPSSTRGVFPFLFRLFSDPAIIRAPWFVRYPLSLYLSLKKLPTMLRRYGAIGGGSPMNGITGRQAEALGDELSRHGRFKVYIANRYCRPDTRAAYRRIKADGVERLIALPMYPQYSTVTTESSFAALRDAIKRDDHAPSVVWVRGFAADKGYIAALAARIRDALYSLPEDKRDNAEMLFSAHSLPREFIMRGDPYVDEIKDTVSAALEVIGPARARLCFQSRGGGKREWLTPDTGALLRELAAEGAYAVLVVPVSFVAENVETLYDVEIMYRRLAAGLGIGHFVRVKCLNDDPAFIKALADIVLERVSSSAARS